MVVYIQIDGAKKASGRGTFEDLLGWGLGGGDWDKTFGSGDRGLNIIIIG